MSEVRLIKIKEEILSDNRDLAASLRKRLRDEGTTFLNIMSSPGSGKTSLILNTIRLLRNDVSIAVVEADLDSTVDADKIAAVNIPAVQIETGGFCHVSAAMFERALETVDSAKTDLLILENVGNLVCPAESDTGAHLNVVILSVPEGDDKPLKYPLIFKGVDAVVLNKLDYLEIAGFDRELFWEHISVLNRDAAVFEVSCTKGDGLEKWADWLRSKLISRS
ncbi:MAG: hydrogenase nickel incorporation protein HypB [Spirochaetales bacterium]|jgi:hydrogenase nickel incorporation protein HypB|nr:hydrogenase nickel incorporation protein HypB [Spirochaetales bacterium]